MRGSRLRTVLAWLVVVGVLGTAGAQYFGWRERARAVDRAEEAVRASRDELGRVQAELAAARQGLRRPQAQISVRTVCGSTACP